MGNVFEKEKEIDDQPPSILEITAVSEINMTYQAIVFGEEIVKALESKGYKVTNIETTVDGINVKIVVEAYNNALNIKKKWEGTPQIISTGSGTSQKFHFKWTLNLN